MAAYLLDHTSAVCNFLIIEFRKRKWRLPEDKNITPRDPARSHIGIANAGSYLPRRTPAQTKLSYRPSRVPSDTVNMETISPPEAAANLTSTWTDTLKSAARQVTTQQVPSAKDLLLAGPRLASKLGSMVMELPSSAYNLVVGGAAETSGLDHVNVVVTSTTVLESTAQAASASPPGLASQISLESGRSVANMLAYATSRWSLACIVMSVVINRTQVYGSTRRPIRIGLRTNVALRILPVALLLWQVRTLLQSIQCQTSPDFASMKWGNASMHSELMFTQNGGWLHDISSTLLFGASDQSSCQTVEMIPLQPDQLRQGHHGGQQPLKTRGSLSRLWPYYQSLCLKIGRAHV